MMPTDVATGSLQQLCDPKNPDMKEMRKGTMLDDKGCKMFRRGQHEKMMDYVMNNKVPNEMASTAKVSSK